MNRPSRKPATYWYTVASAVFVPLQSIVVWRLLVTRDPDDLTGWMGVLTVVSVVTFVLAILAISAGRSRR